LSFPTLYRSSMRRSTGGLHRRRASSSSPSRPPHHRLLLQAEVGMGDGVQTGKAPYSTLDYSTSRLPTIVSPPPRCCTGWTRPTT
jgi:hypothetical protein